MNKKLAIKGHPTRGKEVIELLEMLGGSNDQGYIGTNTWKDEYYFLDNGCIRAYDWCDGIKFTLEEFWEKYPFKIGDKVVYTKYGDNCDDYPVIIESMRWTGTTIEYTFDDCVTCLAKDLKMWNGEPDAVISGIYLNSCDYADEVELNLGDYEIEVRDGRTFAVKKKPKYPATFEECLNLLYCKSVLRHIIGHKAELLLNLEKLLICRDAYWRVAGEEMGLDKSWEFENPSRHYIFTIENFGGKIQKNTVTAMILNRILVFPIEEMRDVFYDNFKDLIESCKELL